jgi:hypothetical protein
MPTDASTLDIRSTFPTPLTPILSARFAAFAVADRIGTSPELHAAPALITIGTHGDVRVHVMLVADELARTTALAERWGIPASRTALTEAHTQHYWAGVVNGVPVELVTCVPRPDPQPEPMPCPDPAAHMPDDEPVAELPPAHEHLIDAAGIEWCPASVEHEGER